MLRRPPRALFAAAASLAAALAVAAQAPAPPPPASSFGEAVDVELVTVQVWVSDRAGQPVTGLSAADFTVLHDGEPVAITHFAEVRAGAPPTPAPSPAATPGGDPGAAAALPAEPVPMASVAPVPLPPEPALLVLYFDQLHLRARDYPALLEGAERLLASGTVPPERVMVLRQDRELHLELPLGSTRDALDVALQRIAATRLAGEVGEVEQVLAALGAAWQESEELTGGQTRMSAAAPGGERASPGSGGTPRAAVGGAGGGSGMGLDSDTCDAFVSRVAPNVEAWVRERNHRTATTVHHLHQTGAILAGVPGVKTLVYLSDALETEPAAPLAAAIGAVCPGQSVEFSQLEMPQDVLALTRHLNTNQVTVHALHASGLRVAESTTAGARTFAGGSRTTRMASTYETAHRTSQRRGMGVLADETGGRLVVNRNDFEAELGRIAREMGSYYSLAYEPPRERAPGEHRIDVKLRDPSLEARYRRGYRAKEGEERLREQLEGALYLGLTSNPLEVRLGAGEIRPQGGRFVLPLHLIVPVERLAFLEGAGGAAAELRLQVLARNAASPRAEWKQQSFRVLRPAQGGGAARLAVELELDAGTNVVAVALRDEGSRTVSLVSTTLQVGG